MITLVSDLHDLCKTTSAIGSPVPPLKAFFDITEIPPGHVHEAVVDVPVVFIQIGGTEHKFKKLFPALVTMIINQLLTGLPGFMINPSVIEGHSILFAHCTVTMTLVDSFTLKTHFESDRGVGIAGMFSPSPVTITKIMGIDLRQYFVLQGRIVLHAPSDRLCRTQVKVIPEQPPGYFLENALGNHHIIGKGHFGARYERLMALS